MHMFNISVKVKLSINQYQRFSIRNMNEPVFIQSRELGFHFQSKHMPSQFYIKFIQMYLYIFSFYYVKGTYVLVQSSH